MAVSYYSAGLWELHRTYYHFRYDCIFIVGHDSPWRSRKSKVKSSVRLKLLRRTLRERRVLAQYVHQLKVPRLQVDDELVGEDMIDIVASIVMACPNLEALVGFQLVYSHKFDRLTHALSTRRKLKEHTWIIGENSDISLRCNTQPAPGLMDAEQVDSFLHFHDAWGSLTTLFLQSHRQGILERDVFIKVLNYLPSLQHLCISQFDMDDFDDIALQALPPLQSLRLQDLEGVTFWGLLDFARGFHGQGIRSLSLINLNITYLSVLSNLLLNLKNLRRFKLIQDSSPMVEPGDLVFQPIVASPRLEFMHWDIVLPGSANENLANSIRANGFPNLRVLRAPSDHDGLLQAVCRPRAQILLPSDKYSQAQVPGIAPGQIISIRMLSGARKAAQKRIEEARKSVQFKLTVEEEGVVHQIYDFNGFIGTIGSKITYNLEPDVPGSDASLVDLGDRAGGNKEVSLKDSCTGMWNASHHGGKRWWSHVERYRYQPLDLQKFF